MKKYTFLLITLVLLASCGTETTVNQEEVTNELPQVEVPNDVLQEIEDQTQIIEEQNEETPVEEEITTDETVNVPVEEEVREASKVVTLRETYTSPGGEEQVSFTLTLEGETITDVSVDGTSDNDISAKRIAAFAEAVDSSVVGKTLSEANNVGVIGGSSLTTGAFKKALKNM